MVSDVKVLRFRVVFTGLFLLLNKVCFGSTAQFKIAPIYESYYGFDKAYDSQTKAVSDVIFYQINGGMRVLCNATLKHASREEEILPVSWYEIIDEKFEAVSNRRQDGIWDARNKTLVISRGQSHPDLAGRQFACRALENGQYEQFSTPQTMTLSYIDEFSVSMERALVKDEGRSVFITCPKPAGAPEPAIFFSHNGSRLETDNNPRLNVISSDALQIEDLELSDSGKYWCTAANANGAVVSPTTTITVETVISNLSFTERPQNISSKAGNSVTLICKFNRKPKLFGWQFRTLNNQAGTVNENQKIQAGKWIRLPSGDLVIENLDRNDSGKYSCYGRDDDNNIYAHAFVSVNYFDISEASGPNDLKAIVGSSVSVSCTIPASFPPAEVGMFQVTNLKGKVQLENSSRYKLRQRSLQYELVIDGVQIEDSGEYHCSSINLYRDEEGNNPFDPWHSAPGSLAVRERGVRPSQFSPKHSEAGDIGSFVVIECSALADPKPTIEWYRSSDAGTFEKVSETEERTEFSSSNINTRYSFKLKLSNLSLEDHDVKYYCKLRNKLGVASSPKYTVLVNHNECQANKKVQEKIFNVQEPAQIACPQSISSHPDDSLDWQYNHSESSFRESGSTLYTDSLTAEDEGEYVCFTRNIAGNCTYTIDLRTQDPRDVTAGGNKTLVFVVAGLAFVVLLVVLFVGILQLRKRSKKKKIASNEALERLNQPVFSSNINGYEDGPPPGLLPPPAANMTHNQLYSTLSKFGTWQIAKNRLKSFSLLGEGQFGSVYKAELKSLDGSPPTWVAIKQIKDEQNSEAIREYEKEMLMMTQLHHPNIVKLVGLCTDSPPYYILTEFMEKGNLAEFLQEVAQSKTDMLSFPDQKLICLQIASGLNYMAEKEFVHRDVAARNCLVGRDLLVKVADFGLSRSVHGREIYQKDGGTVPIRWMSPEAIQYGHYTTANDVWAYAVTIWEVFSYGVIPYSAWTNEDVATNVQAGSRLIRPDSCPQAVYNMMLHSWSELPDYRPTFRQIIDNLNAL